jgi:hypothetical protein
MCITTFHNYASTYRHSHGRSGHGYVCVIRGVILRTKGLTYRVRKPSGCTLTETKER